MNQNKVSRLRTVCIVQKVFSSQNISHSRIVIHGCQTYVCKIVLTYAFAVCICVLSEA